jgi:hypothetical protein
VGTVKIHSAPRQPHPSHANVTNDKPAASFPKILFVLGIGPCQSNAVQQKPRDRFAVSASWPRPEWTVEFDKSVCIIQVLI